MAAPQFQEASDDTVAGSPAARRSSWRWPAAAAALVVAAAHVPITREHLHEAPYIGWSFLALEMTLTVVAVLLVARDSAAVWWTAGVVPALAITAYAVTRSVALPQIADDKGSWTDPLGFVALLFEVLLIGFAVKGGTGRTSSGADRRSLPLVGAGLLLTVGLVAVLRAVAAGGG